MTNPPLPVRLFLLTALVAGLGTAATAQNGAEVPAKKVPAKKAVTKEAAGKKKPPVSPIWVVDMARAATHTKAYKSGRASRARMAETFQKDLTAMKARIKSLKLEIEIMQPSPERMNKELERESLISRHQLAAKMYQSQIDKAILTNDNKVYKELTAAVAELAKRRGILLVLRKHPQLSVRDMLEKKLVKSDAAAQSAVMRGNQQRGVIYHATDLDLTADLIKYLQK